jgi:acyl transferase domain-containing protein
LEVLVSVLLFGLEQSKLNTRQCKLQEAQDMTGATMSQTVLLCPGQGAQSIGMGTAWAASSAAARAVIEAADRATSLPIGKALSTVCAEGPLDQLSRTDISQPALYTVGVACAAAMRERAPLSLGAAAGLSLGEYTALHLAGAFSFEDGDKIVKISLSAYGTWSPAPWRTLGGPGIVIVTSSSNDTALA